MKRCATLRRGASLAVIIGILVLAGPPAVAKPAATTKAKPKAAATKKGAPAKKTVKKAPPTTVPTPAQDAAIERKALPTVADMGPDWGANPAPDTVQGVGLLFACDALPAVAATADSAAILFDKTGRTLAVVMSAYKDVATATKVLGLWADAAAPTCLSNKIRDQLLEALGDQATIESLDVRPLPPQPVGEQAALLYTNGNLGADGQTSGFVVNDLVVRQGRFVFLVEALVPDSTADVDVYALAKKLVPRLKG
ncbi:MAG: hypothetical protein JF603_10805 [Acidobacteria bacterium]|nr:hypothetical protein [Acidobacteriota bacterium]